MIIDKAKEYSQAGLSVLPVANKIPTINTWKPLQEERLSAEEIGDIHQGKAIRGGTIRARSTPPTGVAVITGRASGNLEVLDVDTKHDLSGTLWERLEEAINRDLPGVLDRAPIVTTGSGGRHIYYRCETIEGNLKLAKNEVKEDTIETRGEGGYAVAPPSPGYTLVSGSLDNIPTITPQERDVLFIIAAMFDESPKEEQPPKQAPAPAAKREPGQLTPLEDYNQRGDVLALLDRHGYREVGRNGDKVKILRPGNPTSPYSGDWDQTRRTLFLFSSQDLPTNKALSASDVYIYLECNKDAKEAARRLRAEGYGSPFNTATPPPAPPIMDTEGTLVSIVNIKTAEALEVDLSRVSDYQSTAGSIVIEGELNQERVRAIASQVASLGRSVFVRDQDKERPVWEYILEQILNSYTGDLTALEEEELLRGVVEYGYTLPLLDRDRYIKTFTSLPDIIDRGIKEETLQIVADQLATTRAKEAQREAAMAAVSKAKEGLDKGDPSALDALQEALNDARRKGKENDIARLLAPMTEEGLADWLRDAPGGIEIPELLLYEYQGTTHREPDPLTIPGGALTIVAGATGHGKTTFLINLALNILAKERKEVVFLSYEEARGAVVYKALVSYIGEPVSINSRKSVQTYFKTGKDEKISSHKRPLFHKKRAEFFTDYIETGRLIVQDITPLTEDLVDIIRGIVRIKPNTSAIFIDYVQLLQLEKAKRSGTRQEELGRICEHLKVVSKETGTPIILGAQFNREVVTPWSMVPTKIREAGDIEHSASLILGIWDTSKSWAKQERDPDKDHYNARKEAFASSPGAPQEGTMYVKILKNREGRDGLEAWYKYDGNAAKIHGINETGLSSLPPTGAARSTARTQRRSTKHF